MIRLKNESKKQISYKITRCAMSNTRKSPEPGEIWDLEHPGEKIPNPSLIVETDEIIIRAGGTVKFEGGIDKSYNEEQAEYLYKTLGVTEIGGHYPVGNQSIPIINKNYLIEVDKDGKETKENLFKKYRVPTVPEVMKEIKLDEPLKDPEPAS